ncbi:MAG: ribosome maturation factor RimM [Candidatus Jidaibacter sp.]|jgi:16S rRNA processing protein RimM|nr:ribosome maturation factor RimM [Candidatus Jidaibacter sp.]
MNGIWSSLEFNIFDVLMINALKSTELPDANICVGVITSASGIKGYVKIKCFTENPEDISTFKNVFDPDKARDFNIKIISIRDTYVIASLAGVTSRNDAETLQNTKLYIKRSELPISAEEEFYHADLLGCKVYFDNGLLVGEVKNVCNFGAGDLIEIHDDVANKDFFYPFNKQFIKSVDIEARVIMAVHFNESIAIAE